MARIRIEELPVLEELGAKQMKGIFGGYYTPPPDARASMALCDTLMSRSRSAKILAIQEIVQHPSACPRSTAHKRHTEDRDL